LLHHLRVSGRFDLIYSFLTSVNLGIPREPSGPPLNSLLVSPNSYLSEILLAIFLAVSSPQLPRPTPTELFQSLSAPVVTRSLETLTFFLGFEHFSFAFFRGPSYFFAFPRSSIRAFFQPQTSSPAAGLIFTFFVPLPQSFFVLETRRILDRIFVLPSFSDS